MKKVFAMMQAAQAEIEEVRRERQEHNAEMINYIKEASRELRRNLLVIQEFIPPEYIRQIEQESTWDESTGEWSIPAISATGNSLRKAEVAAAGASGVISDASAAGDGDIASSSRQALRVDLEKQCEVPFLFFSPLLHPHPPSHPIPSISVYDNGGGGGGGGWGEIKRGLKII
jgi:hypothetical protein